MKLDSAGIRKAAILVSSLDMHSADRVLDQFEPEAAQQLRQAMVDLGDVDPAEQQAVLEEFFHAGSPGLNRATAKREPPVSSFMIEEPTPRKKKVAADAADDSPFQFLHEAEEEKLAKVLASERAQTIALVLSHLPPEQAGAVLVQLGSAQQVEVIHRLVDLEETDPVILHEVEQALETRLSQQISMQRRRVAGLKAVAGILQASPRTTESRLMKNLATRDRQLAERLGPPPMRFEQLQNADEETWAEIIGEADADVVLLALVGASPRLVDRILRRVPAGQAALIRNQLNHPGPMRLSDVELAREQLAELAHELALMGRIDIDHRYRAPARVAA